MYRATIPCLAPAGKFAFESETPELVIVYVMEAFREYKEKHL
jgi:hypothetical protein